MEGPANLPGLSLCSRYALSMQVRVLYFGAIREAAGEPHASLDLGGDAVAGDVLAYAQERLPWLACLLARTAIAVNQSYVSPEHRLQEGDEVALLPPVSGGAGTLV